MTTDVTPAQITVTAATVNAMTSIPLPSGVVPPLPPAMAPTSKAPRPSITSAHSHIAIIIVRTPPKNRESRDGKLGVRSRAKATPIPPKSRLIAPPPPRKKLQTTPSESV